VLALQGSWALSDSALSDRIPLFRRRRKNGADGGRRTEQNESRKAFEASGFSTPPVTVL